MFGNKIVITVFLVLSVALATVSGVGYWYYKKSQETIMQLQENNSMLKVSVQELTTTIQDLEKNFQAANRTINELNSTLSTTRVKNRELADRLAKHDISMLAMERPNLVEKIINNASKEAARCFELLSGAALNEKEKKATNEKEFNSECPWLYSSITRP